MDAADDLTVLELDESLFVESPLLKDPYVWDQCAITVEYVLLPNKIVQVSARNHEDRTVEKEFAANEVPLPVRGGKQIDGSCACDTQMIIRPPSRWEQSIAMPKISHWASKQSSGLPIS